MRVDGKPEGLRQSMSWVHTYSGLLMGWLLYAVFFTGTFSYFRNEINDWMRPELHASVQNEQTLERSLATLHAIAPDSENWSITLPNPRSVAVNASYRDANADPNNPRAGTKRVLLDASTGAEVTPRQTQASNFFYRFHFELHAMPRTWGRWIVGIATMLMFVAIISGVITHKKIFSDFFTFRPKKGQRSWLDAHNATAVLALPFHIVITFSGLLLLTGTILPYGNQAISDGSANARGGGGGGRGGQQQAPARGPQTAELPSASQNTAPTLAPLAPMLLEAQRQWPVNGVGSISIEAPNTSRAIVTLNERGSSSLVTGGRGGGRSLQFDGISGKLREPAAPTAAPPSLIRKIRSVVVAIHEGRFAGPIIRSLLFLSGVLGTFMAASGMVLWVVKRLPERRKLGRTPFSHRLVEILNVGAIGGLSVAFATLFWMNRLLPADMLGRADWEIHGFFIAWGLCALHPLLCSHRAAWLHQMALATLMYALLPLLNAFTGGSSLFHSLMYGQHSLVSVEIVLLGMAALHGSVVWWLLKKPAAKPAGRAAAKARPVRAAPLRPTAAGVTTSAAVPPATACVTSMTTMAVKQASLEKTA